MPNVGPNTVNVIAKQIKGIVPLLDARALDVPVIVDGRNFMLDFQGPFSTFQSKLFSQQRYSPLGWFQNFQIESDTRNLIFTRNSVFEFDVVTQQVKIIFTFADDGVYWPWTMAQVNTEYFFCKKNLGGVLHFSPVNNTWTLMVANVPDFANSVCKSQGRLVICGDTFYAWSALDDGTNLSPNLTSGAGFQSITAIIGGTTVAPVKEVADGFIVFTNAGIAKAEFSQSLSIFRHYPLSRAFKPINPYCVISIDDLENKSHVFLDEKGLFKCNGTVPTVFDGLFSQFLRDTFLPEIKSTLSDPRAIKLTYDSIDRQWLYISIQSQSNGDLYDYAFVFNTNKQEWGRFDSQHYALFNMWAASGTLEGDNFAYLDVNGYIRYFIRETFNEAAPSSAVRFYWQNYHDSSPIWVDTAGVMRASSNLPLTTEDTHSLSSAGAYVDAGNNTYSPYLATNTGFASFIKIGLFRLTEAKYDDEVGMFTNVALAVDNIPSSLDEEDWANFGSNVSEDWTNMGMPVEEDWGFNILNGILFTANIIGTNDGENTWGNQDHVLQLQLDEGKNKYYVCDCKGIYHILVLSATTAGQAFHLRLAELTGTMVGRL